MGHRNRRNPSCINYVVASESFLLLPCLHRNTMGFLLKTTFSEVGDQSFMLSSFIFVFFPIILN